MNTIDLHTAPIETNPLENDHNADRVSMTLTEFAAADGQITRVRVLTEATVNGRYADFSYIYGTLADGTLAHIVDHPRGTMLRNLKGAIIDWAKSERVYAKRLGLLDELNWSILY